MLCIAGDGSIQMNLQEMATAMISRLPVKTFILNNHFHGMVQAVAGLFYEGRYASSYLDTVPDFVKMCRGLQCGWVCGPPKSRSGMTSSKNR